MKFKHLFYDNTVDFRKIFKRRLITSIVLGLLSAFLIYSTFYVLREGFRLLSFGFENAPNIISESNRSFYNLFFAFLSLIFGNSIGISFLVSRPSSFLSRRNPKRRRIINDQVFLNLNFVYWLGKIGLMFGIFSNYMDFQFLPYLYAPLILLIIVMYLESWKTLILVLGKHKFKVLAMHLLLISMLGFALSKISIVDYKSLDDAYLSDMPTYNYPHSFFDSSYNNLYRNSLIKLGLKLDKNDDLIIRTEDKEYLQLNELNNFIASERNAYDDYFMYKMIVHVSADRDLKLKHIKAFEAALYINNLHNVWYQTNNPDILTKRFAIQGFKKRINELALEFKTENQLPYPALPTFLEMDFSRFNNIIKIEVDDIITFDNKLIGEKELIKAFETRIDSITLFEYNLNLETAYQNYITVLSSHLKAIQNKRQNKATFDISGEYYHYNKEEKDKLGKLMDEFPTLIKEVKKEIME